MVRPAATQRKGSNLHVLDEHLMREEDTSEREKETEETKVIQIGFHAARKSATGSQHDYMRFSFHSVSFQFAVRDGAGFSSSNLQAALALGCCCCCCLGVKESNRDDINKDRGKDTSMLIAGGRPADGKSCPVYITHTAYDQREFTG